MRTVYLIYSQYYSFEDHQPKIGGVESYITNLCEVIKENLSFHICVIQLGKENKECMVGNIRIVQIHGERGKKGFEKLSKYVKSNININDLVIYMTDTLISPKYKFANSIAIQHGIAFDMPKNKKRLSFVGSLIKFYEAVRTIKRLKNASKIVCVDYNFPNWYRTQLDKPEVELKIIPNFTEIGCQTTKPNDSINIIFARRLYWYRGTAIFTKAIKSILNEEKNIFVTVAGEGPDESMMRAELGAYKNIEFIKYQSLDSLTIHKDKHIAVVPTVGSEGTSLSLLEAMSSGCAVVCTDVGGMTNIVLDGHNGLMIPSGDSNQLYLAIKKLIHDEKLRLKLSKNAIDTVKDSFSYEIWKDKWIDILKAFED